MHAGAYATAPLRRRPLHRTLAPRHSQVHCSSPRCSAPPAPPASSRSVAARCAQPCPQEEPPPAPRRLTALAALAAQRKEKVAIIGSGNWGSAIAKVVGRNLLELGDFVSIGDECDITCHTVENMVIKLATVKLGNHATMSVESVVMPGASMEAGAVLCPNSQVLKGETVEPAEVSHSACV